MLTQKKEKHLYYRFRLDLGLKYSSIYYLLDRLMSVHITNNDLEILKKRGIIHVKNHSSQTIIHNIENQTYYVGIDYSKKDPIRWWIQEYSRTNNYGRGELIDLQFCSNYGEIIDAVVNLPLAWTPNINLGIGANFCTKAIVISTI